MNNTQPIETSIGYTNIFSLLIINGSRAIAPHGGKYSFDTSNTANSISIAIKAHIYRGRGVNSLSILPKEPMSADNTVMTMVRSGFFLAGRL